MLELTWYWRHISDKIDEVGALIARSLDCVNVVFKN
jgi:hypothetical protein